jgi:hypothetical protein
MSLESSQILKQLILGLDQFIGNDYLVRRGEDRLSDGGATGW